MQEIRRFRPSTVSRRFSVTAGFYRTCVIDGPLPLRWVYFHVLRELAQHGGHADILREQILNG
jgi:Protein of unknown function (DUF664)